MRKWLLIFLLAAISLSAVYGINFLSNASTDDVVCYRIKENLVKAGDQIKESDVYQDKVPKGAYKDIASLADIKGKYYSVDLQKDDIIRKISVASIAGATNFQLADNEGIYGIKTDLYASAGASIEKGDNVTIVGIRKDAMGLETVDVFPGVFEVVSIKTDKALSIEEAKKQQSSNNLVVPIPAVITVRISNDLFSKFASYSDFKLIKR